MMEMRKPIESRTPLKAQTVVMMVAWWASLERICMAGRSWECRLAIERGGPVKRERAVQPDSHQQGEKQHVAEDQSLVQRQHGRSPVQTKVTLIGCSWQTRTARVRKRTGKAVLCLRRQNDPGDAEGLQPGLPLGIGGAVELLRGLRPTPPGRCRLGEVAGDAAVFKPVGHGASFRRRAKALRIFSGAFDVVVIQGKDGIFRGVGANPEESLLPMIAG